MKTLDKLTVNEAQWRAITHGEGVMLVLAGPGSGKTFTVTQRIKYMIEHYHVKPEDILVITFTKAAAGEMQERFVKLNGGKIYPVHFGTFHSVFFRILRHTYKFTAQNIIKERDKYRLLSHIMEEMPPEIRPQGDAPEYGADCQGTADKDSDGVSVETLQGLLSEISKVKNNGMAPQELKSSVVPQQEFEYIFAAYKRAMNQNRLVDFDDMVLLCRDLLVSRPETLAIWQKRFQYILVDEFQDICPLQYEVVRLLASPQDNLFIVGDDDQSIYGFRGSRPEIMLRFPQDYPKAQQVLLNVNYRSTKGITDTAGKLIAHNRARFQKAAEAQDARTDGVKIYSFESGVQQAQNIAFLIKQYMGQPGARYGDIAVLYRTSSSMAYTADRLMKEGIPFILKEKPRNIYESAVAKDVISYIRYALYEDRLEDFFRIMNRPVRYIKRSTVPRKPFKRWQLLENNNGAEYCMENILEFYSGLDFIKQQDPFSAVNYIRKGIGYDAYVEKQAKEHGRDGAKELEELDTLLQLAKGFGTLKQWLGHIENYGVTAEEALRQGSRQKESDADAVSIATMHASKGLEWKVVVLPDLNEGVVPHKKAVTDEEIEEERRMFYVAMTRAKESLFLFYVQKKGAGNLLPSRFLDELMDG